MTAQDVRPDQHGTRTGYTYGCRCPECRQAKRESRTDEPSNSSPAVMDAVLKALRDEADMDGLVTSSSHRIGDLCGHSNKTVLRAVKQLEESGLLKTLGRSSTRGQASALIQLAEVDA